MDELKQALASITDGGAALNAVIVDDEFEGIGVPSFAEWTELKDTLQQWPDFHDELMEQLVALRHNPVDPPPTALITTAISQLEIAPNDTQRAALDLYTRSKHVLQRLQDFLQSLGFTVSCHPRQPTFSENALPFLCVVDYQLDPEQVSGATAVTIFESLMDLAEKGQQPPPFVVLMSKALTDDDVGKWSELAEKANFFRFNYDFLNKEQFLTNSAYLEYALLHFVRYKNLSRSFFLQMNSLVTEAHGIATQVCRKLFQVTPPEALLFKNRLFREGSHLSIELSNLFAELFSHQIKLSENVIERMNALECAVTEEGVPAPHRQQSSALHHLYAELLHQPCDPRDSEPAFGDIFEGNSGTYVLILSQECDLAAGEGRRRKTDRVIAIEGELKNASPQKSAGEMIIAKPLFIAGDDQQKWLWWNLERPVILLAQQFKAAPSDEEIELRAYFISERRQREGVWGEADHDWMEAKRQLQVERECNRLKKKWKLRFADAEDIQHTFATRMTRVALNVMPEFVHVHIFRLSRNTEVIDEAPPIYIYQVEEKFALAPESQGACYAVDNGVFMSDALIKKLGAFVTHETFRKALEDEQLMPLVEGKELLLAKTTQQFRRGKKAWKGLT